MHGIVAGWGESGYEKQVLVYFENWKYGHNGKFTPTDYVGETPPKDSTEYWWILEDGIELV